MYQVPLSTLTVCGSAVNSKPKTTQINCQLFSYIQRGCTWAGGSTSTGCWGPALRSSRPTRRGRQGFEASQSNSGESRYPMRRIFRRERPADRKVNSFQPCHAFGETIFQTRHPNPFLELVLPPIIL